MYDCAVIGTGPAGLSAVINLKLHEKHYIWFGSSSGSSKVEKSEKIANMPGMGLVSGSEMNARLAAHREELGLVVTNRMVTSIMPGAGGYMLLADNEIFEAKTLILALGAVPPKGFPGESELLGRGVSYCATCDGFLYKGKTLAVWCGSPRYDHEVSYLAELAETVYLFTPYPSHDGELSNVIRPKGKLKQVLGEMRISGLLLTDGSELPVDGLFILRDAVAPATLLPGLAIEGPHILVNRACETNLPGCFACGDCTGRPYQIAKAVGEGNVAAHSALEYLSKMAEQ